MNLRSQIDQSALKFAVIYAAVFSVLLSGCSTAPESEINLSSIDLRSAKPSSPTPGNTDSENSSPVSDSFAELELEDQSGSGERVAVEEVRLSLGRGFLVITDLAGNYLGSAIATPDSQPVVVQLDKQLLSSQELIGTLYLDNGDGIFGAESDVLIRDSEGEIVREDFDYKVNGN